MVSSPGISGALVPGVGGETALMDAMYPVGSSLTFPALAFANAISGSTAPELGASGGYFAAYDGTTTETLAFTGFGMLVPRSWLTFHVYLESFNFTGSAGDVVWRTTYASGGGDVDTTISYPDSGSNISRVAPAVTYTLDTFTVAGVVRKGGAMKVARVGGAAADTLVGDVQLASLNLVRVT